MKIRYECSSFEELSLTQLYTLLQLRAEVFVVEQDCVYQDLDGKDQRAYHLLGYAEDGRLACYTRLLPRGVSYPEYASIGRVITAPFARGKGLGRALMETSITALHERWGWQAIKISAQAHLQTYYGSVGFTGTGPVYAEDGIPHRAMIYAVD